MKALTDQVFACRHHELIRRLNCQESAGRANLLQLYEPKGCWVEEIIERVKCPSAPLEKCPQSPITDGELIALSRNLVGTSKFRGVWTIAADGTPVAILHALDETNFRAARLNMTGVVTWNWPHRAGSLVSFTLVIRGQRSPRIFVSPDSAFVRAVAERGRAAFSVSFGGQLSPFYLADFTKHPEHPDMLEAFRVMLKWEDHEKSLVRDDELAYWLLMLDPKSNWHADLSIRDKMRARWARHYDGQLKTLAIALEDLRDTQFSNGVYVNAEARTNAPATMPFFDEVVRCVTTSTNTISDQLALVIAALPDAKKLGDLVHGVLRSYTHPVVVEPIKWVVRELLWTAILSPESTKCGQRRPWLDGRVGDGDFVVRYIDIDPVALGEQASDYWIDFEFQELFDLGNFVTGRDMHVPRLALYKEMADVKLACTEADADEAIRGLLTEARENRQWSAPWGARVQVNIGTLKYLDLYEIEGEFAGIFRDSQERFLMIPVNISTGQYSPPQILRADADEKTVEENAHAALALVLVVASVVRDFLVVEDRHAQFSSKPAKGVRCSTNEALSIIYLPRVRYYQPDVTAFLRETGDSPHRSPHDVEGHLRKAENATATQMLLAARYGFGVPRGYTFVRPHRRGDPAAPLRQRIYRSRSATAILYRTLQKAPAGSRSAWFDFEKDVAALMKQMGFRVIHQAASRNGDGGIDIFAHDEKQDVVWAIQCKCYASARTVGPNIIRELAGSLLRFPSGTCGMIVTTSTFTPKAIEDADSYGFKLVDGQAFANCLKTGHIDGLPANK